MNQGTGTRLHVILTKIYRFLKAENVTDVELQRTKAWKRNEK